MRVLGRPRLWPWVPPLCSCTPLAAAELGQSPLDASRVAVDNLVQAEDCRTAGWWGRQRKAWGTLLRKAAKKNRASAPTFLKLLLFLQVKSQPLLFPVQIQVFLGISEEFYTCTGLQSKKEQMFLSTAFQLFLRREYIPVFF